MYSQNPDYTDGVFSTFKYGFLESFQHAAMPH